MKTISTDNAEAFLDDEVPLIDVRTPDEFADGHIPGALNIPLKLDLSTRELNADFVGTVAALFAKDQPLIVSCQAGGRSKSACQLLEEEGFSELMDMEAGFGGKKDAFGRVVPGWSQEGRDVEVDADTDQTYEGLKRLAAERAG